MHIPLTPDLDPRSEDHGPHWSVSGPGRIRSFHQAYIFVHILLSKLISFSAKLTQFLLMSASRKIQTLSLSTAISALPSRPSLSQTQQAHARLITAGLSGDTHLVGRLIAALSSSTGTPSSYSLSLFRSIENPSVFASNNSIRCLAKSEKPRESITLYRFIRRETGLCPNEYTFPFLLQACSKDSALFEGAQVHSHVIRHGFGGNLYIRNNLIHFYGACYMIECAEKVFDEYPQWRDVVTWNAMLGGYVRGGRVKNVEKMFNEMPERDVISWSIKIMGYVQNGKLEEGIECFREMRDEGLVPNEAILVMVLSASAQLGMLDQGRFVHSVINFFDFPVSVPIGTGLIDMYAKCGSIDQARVVFSQMPKKGVCSWNAMICGLAAHGLGKEALSLFEIFLNKGLIPVNVTFIGVLNCCSRAGLVNEGRHYFKMMRETYGIDPEMEHYGCMVDLLGRAGLVSEAVDLIEQMTVQPYPVLWGTLLGACKNHGLIELGEKIGKKLIDLDPTHEGHYVQLSGIYAKQMKWEDVLGIRRLMLDRKANKSAGWSLIEAQGRAHLFVASDRDHGSSFEIYKMLQVIGTRIAEAGYRPNLLPVLHDIIDEEKEDAVKEHSERLAIAFGFLTAGPDDCIRIIKNLRVCRDCHEFTKFVSKVYKREIIVRDGSRFHRFKEGECSCLDYW